MDVIGALSLSRHLLRRWSKEQAGNPETADEAAAAHEIVCELLGKACLANVLCHLAEDEPSNSPHVRQIGVIGAAIGLDHALILDLEAASLGGMKSQGSGNSATVGELHGKGLGS